MFLADNIRKRPGMYVGSTSIAGIYNLIEDLVNEIIFGSNKVNICIAINLNENNTLIFVCDTHVDVKDSICVEIIKALSDICELTFGCEHSIYNKGLFVSKTKRTDNCTDSLKIMFRPDMGIFSYEGIDYYMILCRIKELAQLNENVKFLLTDEENRNVIQFRRGLDVMLTENIYWGLESRKPLNIFFAKDDIEVSVSMVYGFAADVRLSYVNNIKTFDGGTHVQGLYDGIFCAFKNYIKKSNYENTKIIRNDVIEGLNFVISVRMKNPEFAGAVKRALANSDVRLAIKRGFTEHLSAVLSADQSFLEDSRAIPKAVVRNIWKTH